MANLIDTAIAKGNFKTLLAAIEAAELLEILSGTEPFTIFAPSDEAFSKLPPAALERLLHDKSKLTAVITYHLVAGRHLACEVSQQASLKTAQGEKVRIKNNAGVTINNAKVVTADICTDNGVLHVIDSVIMPTWLRHLKAARPQKKAKVAS